MYASIDEAAGLKIEGSLGTEETRDGSETALTKRLVTYVRMYLLDDMVGLEFTGARGPYPFFYDLGSTYFLNGLQEYMEN